jgi:hypothetical protein
MQTETMIEIAGGTAMAIAGFTAIGTAMTADITATIGAGLAALIAGKTAMTAGATGTTAGGSAIVDAIGIMMATAGN